MIHENEAPSRRSGDRPSSETCPGAARERLRGPGILANTSGGGSRLSALAIGPKKGPAREGLPGATRNRCSRAVAQRTVTRAARS